MCVCEREVCTNLSVYSKQILLFKEKEKLEFRLKTIEDKVTTMENEYKNQKNELINARLEASSWEKQLEKEREKLAKMKSEKKYLMDEVRDIFF